MNRIIIRANPTKIFALLETSIIIEKNEKKTPAVDKIYKKSLNNDVSKNLTFLFTLYPHFEQI